MAERIVTKALITHEDLALGQGTTSQTRQGSSVNVTKIDLPWVVTTLVDLKRLDTTKYSTAILNVGGDSILYKFDDTSTEAADDVVYVAPDIGDGRWYRVIDLINLFLTLSGSSRALATYLNNKEVANYAELKALDTSELTIKDSIFVKARAVDGDGGDGIFYFDNSDLSSEVGNDPGEGVYAPPDSDTSGNSGAFVRRTDDSNVDAQWFGVRSGTSDYGAEMQNALDFVKNVFGAGEVHLPAKRTYTFTGPLTIHNSVTLDAHWADIRPFNNANMFTVRPGGTLRQIRALTSTLAGFSSKIAILAPTQNTLGAQLPPWIDGLNCYMADTGGGGNTGDAVSMNSATYWIQEMMANDIVVWFGRRAIDLSTSVLGTFCNGNVFNGLITHNAAYTIYEDSSGGGPASGNIYTGVMSQGNTTSYGKIRLNSGANVNCLLWDNANIEFAGPNNLVIAYCDIRNAVLSDEARNNKLIGAQGYYSDLRSITTYNDVRNDRFQPGWMRIEDTIMGQLDSRWTQTTTGTSSITYSTYAFGATNFLRGIAAVLATGAAGTDQCRIDFGGNGPCRTSQAPTLHATIQTNTDTPDRKIFIGMYGDTNNYIGFEVDPATYGDVVWRAVTRSGGVSTVTSVGQGSSARIQWPTILVKSSGVEFRMGIIADNNSTVIQGVNKQELSEGGFQVTHTTNIPNGVNLEPRIQVQEQTTTAKFMRVLDIQFNCAMSDAY